MNIYKRNHHTLSKKQQREMDSYCNARGSTAAQRGGDGGGRVPRGGGGGGRSKPRIHDGHVKLDGHAGAVGREETLLAHLMIVMGQK